MRMPLEYIGTLAVCAALAGGCAAPRPGAVERLGVEQAQSLGVSLPRPLTLQEIIAASREGEEPERIVQRLKASKWDYRLGENEAVELHEAGVSDVVIDYLTATRRAEERSRAAEEARLRRWAYDPYWGWYGLGGYGPGWHRWPHPPGLWLDWQYGWPPFPGW